MKVVKLVAKLVTITYLLSNFALANHSQNNDYSCKALVRNSKHRLKEQTVVLKDLVSKTSFDGKFVKIVEAKSEKAINFDHPLAFRACHVYFHIQKARDFFLQTYNIVHLRKPRKLVVRIEMDLMFNDSTHFIHENLGKSYNNAITIPPSGLGRLEEIKPWYYEIWFAPKKKIKVKTSFQKAAELASSGPVMRDMLFGIGESQLTIIATQIAQGANLTRLEGEFYLKSLLLNVGISALVPTVFKVTSPLFKKSIYLDSAMIPEVIYHEFTHFALSSTLSIERHSPVVEGIANYFAAVIGKTDTILKKSRKFAKGLAKVSAKGEKKYEYYMEDKTYAQLDFSFKFLYALKKEFGEERANQIVYGAAKFLKNKDLSIKGALLDALKAQLSSPLNPIESISQGEIYKFQKIVQEFGI